MPLRYRLPIPHMGDTFVARHLQHLFESRSCHQPSNSPKETHRSVKFTQTKDSWAQGTAGWLTVSKHSGFLPKQLVKRWDWCEVIPAGEGWDKVQSGVDTARIIWVRVYHGQEGEPALPGMRSTADGLDVGRVEASMLSTADPSFLSVHKPSFIL